MSSNPDPPKSGFVCPPKAHAKNCAKKFNDYLSWNDYFMAVALLSAKRSRDPNTQVGACIVDKENRIVGIGYNAFPQKISDDEFPWTKLSEDDTTSDPINEKYFYVVHAEANAILNKNVESLKGTKIYTTLFPCNECAKLILQSEINEVIYISDKYSEKPSFRASKRLLDAACVKYTRFIPLTSVVTIDFNELIQEELNQHLSEESNSRKNSKAPSTTPTPTPSNKNTQQEPQ